MAQVERLQAELEQAREERLAERSVFEKVIARLGTEADAARQELVRAQAAIDAHHRRYEELKHWCDGSIEEHHMLMGNYREAQAENAKLREALVISYHIGTAPKQSKNVGLSCLRMGLEGRRGRES